MTERKIQVRVSPHAEWSEVVDVVEEKEFTVQPNGDETFPRQWRLSDGTEISPLNPNLEIRDET